ncbi:MAG: glycerol-3-phosphate 1-O-acyltransferase PlsY [Candidatus Omnitrophica bacterium]|nr:glycerol-3-phosphate 1-O-acyltransferase PlsY [Candidatus Omnitrophota bacterium]
MLWTIAALILSYLLGSIPTAYLFGKALKGIDIRKIGSGNVGATNALRALGRGPGAAVLFLDILKGLIAVSFLGDLFVGRDLLFQEYNLRIIMGLCSISGHIWTIFLNFKGGKGIATSFGVLLGLALRLPGLGVVILILIFTWLTVFVLTRIVSLSSIAAALVLPLCVAFFGKTVFLFAFSLLLSVFVIFRHKANISRILQGKEPRLYFKRPPK